MARTGEIRLGHVNLEVSDLRRSRRFYDRALPVLGFRPLPRSDAAWLGYRSPTLTLWLTASRPPRVRRQLPHIPTDGRTDPISEHLGFVVGTEAEVRSVERRLRRRGIPVVYGFDRTPTAGPSWYVSCAFRDPDNLVLEVYAVRRRGLGARRAARRAGRSKRRTIRSSST